MQVELWNFHVIMKHTKDMPLKSKRDIYCLYTTYKFYFKTKKKWLRNLIIYFPIYTWYQLFDFDHQR